MRLIRPTASPGRRSLYQKQRLIVRRTRLSDLHIHYLVGEDTHVAPFTERHAMGSSRLRSTRRASGSPTYVDHDFDPVGPFGKGLYIGTKAR